MKKFFVLLVMLSFPALVNAQVFTENDEFFVGDSVNVALYADTDVPDNSKASDGTYNGNGFHVIADSKAGSDTVRLIYDGTVEGTPTVYDKANPDEGHEATTILDNSIIGTKLAQAVNADGKKWRIEGAASLLSAGDLSNLNITKNAAGIYEIPAKYSFLAPIKIEGLDSTHYNYWTSISDESAQTASIYCVNYNEDRTDPTGVWATLVSNDISGNVNTTECAIRPVVEVQKKYILCLNTPREEKKDNPKTGITDYVLPLASVVLIAGTLIYFTRRNEMFKSI